MMNQDALKWLVGQRNAMISLLDEIVSIDSASDDKAGVDRVGTHIRAFLERNGVTCKVEPLADRDDALHAHAGVGGGN